MACRVVERPITALDEWTEIVRARAARLDVVHSTFYRGMPRRVRKYGLVSTLFDMAPERHPEYFYGLNPHYNKMVWLEASDHIVSISKSAADDLIRYRPDFQDKISVIHLTHQSDRWKAPKTDESDRPGKGYFLYVGGRGGYKRFDLFAQAYSKLFSEMPSDKRPRVVCAGGAPFKVSERQSFQKLGISGDFIHCSPSDSDLQVLYRDAEAVVVTSAAEGFSIPLVESLWCNTRIICSDIEVHREIGYGYSNYFRSEDGSELTELIASASQLKRPMEMLGGDAYTERIQYYSNQRMVDQHRDVYLKFS